MNFQGYLDSCDSVTCIMSVEKKPGGGYGDIRIVAGNQAYIDSIERNEDENSDIAKEKVFVPNSLYTKYFPHELNFEDFCYRAAVKKKCLHTYVRPERFNFWFNLFFMPLKSDDENIGYCSYTFTVTMNADAELMSNIAPNISSSVLQTCIQLYSNSDFQTSIDETISFIRKLCKADHCCLLLTDFTSETCSILSDDHANEEHRAPFREIINDEFFNVVATWPETIAGSDHLMIKNEQDMQVLNARNPAWYRSLKQYNVKSLVLFPLYYGSETKGYIWVTDFDVENALMIRETLELTTYFVSYAVANYQLLNRLETMSTVDMLTGTKNRNAMNNRVSALVNGDEPYPEHLHVVFADLNGLKQANDNEGHPAGDRLLKQAALILQECFPEQEVYRAGGDEFTVFAVGLSDGEFADRIEELRKYTDGNESVSFAIGFCSDNGRHDIRYDMKIADERMYADKEKFYKRFPKQRHI